ncbi:MAG TPA: PQQ-binding-like beta-propeller repeat protein [Pirellulales bacterium]|nr:PQQ-binding-like beta-propeller repeat protein [Pirellulales bacterium]
MTPAWEASLGTGWSSPVVAENRVFVTDRVDDTERVLAFDAKTGRELWKDADPVDFDPHAVGARHGNGPKSTPVLFRGRIYALGIAGRLQCLDAASGEPVWEVNYPDRFGTHQKLPRGRAYVNGTDSVIVPVGKGEGAPVPLFGYTGSLLVAGNLVVSSVGGAKGGTIMAFDANTGQEVWRSLHDQVSYSSPVAARLAGIEQVVVMTGPEVVGLDLATGRKLWGHPFQIQYNESISTPSVADPYVVVTGDGRPLTALKVEKSEGGCSLEVAWQNRDLSSYLSSMIIRDGHVYGMNDGGELGCVRLSDGKTIWLEGHFGFYSTPVLAGSRLLCLNERGRLFVLEATPAKSPKDFGETKLSERATWSSPALADGRLYIRADGQLLAFDLP